MSDLGSGSSAALRDAKREMLARLLARDGLVADTPAIGRRGEGDATPLTHAQEVLWLLDQATPGLIAYNSALAFRLRGSLDVAVLQRALDGLAARHEALRTRFVAHDDRALQVIDAPRAVALAVEDLRGRPVGSREAESARLLREHARRPFALADEHLFRAALVRLTDDEQLLLLLTHHIVSDAWSYGVMVRELSELYAAALAGRASSLPAPAIQFGDFAAWERSALTGERLRESLDYWRNMLLPAAPDLLVPADRPRGSAPAFEGGRALLTLPRPLLDRLKALAAAEGATLYMVLLAGFQSLLHRWSGQDDVVTGSAIAGRTRSETEGVIGYFSAALPLRTRFIDGESFRALLGRVRSTVLGALEHQDVPAEALVNELQTEGRKGHAPLFQVVLTMQENQGGRLELDGVTVTPYEVESGTTKFELTLLPAERPEGLELLLWFRTDLFEQATADRLLNHLASLLDAAASDPNAPVDELPILSSAERAELQTWNATTRDLGAATTVVQQFETQAERVPDRLAVVGSAPGDASLTYAALNARANQVAHRLRAGGVGPNVPVGLLLDRSTDAIVGLLGILKAGGAYVPLSVEAPPARIAQQLAECGGRNVVTSSAHAARLPISASLLALDSDPLSALPDTNIESTVTPRDLAYVLFTSGSTGTAKGVAVTHANAVHYARAVSRVLAGIDPAQSGDGLAALDGLHFGMVSTLAADLGNTSLLPALLSGGTLHVLTAEIATEPARFAEYVAVHPLDVLKATPNHMLALAAGRSGAELASVLPRTCLVLGGEPLRPDTARAFLGAGTCRVLNHYGPTETTVGVCTCEVTSEALEQASARGAQTVPIGRPLANTHAYVVDARGLEVPVGTPGELLIGGAGVARGYLGRPELTAERFVELRGERAYRTGDRVRRRDDGTLEFLGRTDDQVKVRGYRVELGEIESVLRSHPGVAQGVVVLRSDDGVEAPTLVAYVVAKQSGYAASHTDRATPATLAAWFGASLPAYMIPTAVVFVDAVPLTANGKVDRTRLPAPEGAAGVGDESIAPRTPTEEAMTAIWREVLKRDSLSVTDNFLALGGHSLLAIRVLGKVSKTFGVRLSLRTLFEAPTVAQLAAAVDQAVRDA